MNPKFLQRLRQRAKALKAELLALWFAYRDRRTPWYAKLWAAMVVGYAFSPIDLIPDFIPVIGYLDDLVIVPLGILLALKMIPPEVMAECRENVRTKSDQYPTNSRAAAAAIIVIWLLAAAVIITIAVQIFRK